MRSRIVFCFAGTTLFVSVSVYIGWIRMSPAIVIAAAAIVSAVLYAALRRRSPWHRSVRAALFTYAVAELFCVIGLYAMPHEGFVLAHDLLHLASLAFLATAAQQRIDRMVARNCPMQCCDNGERRWSDACPIRIAAIAAVFTGAILSALPVAVWTLHQQHPFLSRPYPMTPLHQSFYLLLLPAVAFALFSTVTAKIALSRALSPHTVRGAATAATALLAYSLFQLGICLVTPAAAIPAEEAAEFTPMVPLLFILLGALRNRDLPLAANVQHVS